MRSQRNYIWFSHVDKEVQGVRILWTFSQIPVPCGTSPSSASISAVSGVAGEAMCAHPAIWALPPAEQVSYRHRGWTSRRSYFGQWALSPEYNMIESWIWMLFGFIFFVDFHGILVKCWSLMDLKLEKKKVVLAADSFRALCTGDQLGLSNRLLVELFT